MPKYQSRDVSTALFYFTLPLVYRMKRENYINFDDYFMSIAVLSAQRSKDPSRQVGACIVNPLNRIVGIGYNGFPTGCSDDILPWAGRNKHSSHENVQLTVTHSLLATKYPYVCHAELNAITNSNMDLRGCRIYVTLFPCNECAKLIIQSGITKVIFLSDKNHHEPAWVASRRLFDMTPVEYRLHNSGVSSIMLTLDEKSHCTVEHIPQRQHAILNRSIFACALTFFSLGALAHRVAQR